MYKHVLCEIIAFVVIELQIPRVTVTAPPQERLALRLTVLPKHVLQIEYVRPRYREMFEWSAAFVGQRCKGVRLPCLASERGLAGNLRIWAETKFGVRKSNRRGVCILTIEIRLLTLS